MRYRRVLTRRTAAIFSSLTRMVPHYAVAISVPLSAFSLMIVIIALAIVEQ